MFSFWIRLSQMFAIVCISVFVEVMAAGVNIQLKSNAYMFKGDVLLRDIAHIEANDKEIGKSLESIFIMKTPRVGYVGKFSLHKLQRLVVKQRVYRNIDISFSGADKINVHSRGREIEYSVLTEKAKKYLIDELKAPDRKVKIDVAENRSTVNLPYGGLKFKARLNSKDITSKMCVWIDVYREGGFYQSIPVWFDVKVFEPVFVSMRMMQRNEVVSETDFKVSNKNIAEIAGKNIKVGKFSERLLLKKKMKPGEIIRIDAVKAVPAVIGGKTLGAVVNEGNLSIRVDAVSNKDAELGEVIRVKSLQSGGVLKAKVIGEQLVEVI